MMIFKFNMDFTELKENAAYTIEIWENIAFVRLWLNIFIRTKKVFLNVGTLLMLTIQEIGYISIKLKSNFM